MDKQPSQNRDLKQSAVFEGLSIEQLEAVIRTGHRRQLHPQDILFYQGEPAKSCFLVTRGQLILTMVNEQGKEVTIRYIGPGEITAAVTALKKMDYPVTGQAVEETETIGWDQPTLVRLMERFPRIAVNLLNIVLERLDDVQHRYLELCSEHVEQRIARTLLRLMRRAGKKTEKGIEIDIPLSRQSIADYSGTTLYTVSRTLSAWEKGGWIHSGRERIVIAAPHALVEFVEIH